MSFWDKIKNKNYWISTLAIVIAIMLLDSTVANFVIKYLGNIPTWLLSFVSIFLITLVVRLLSEEILEV